MKKIASKVAKSLLTVEFDREVDGRWIAEFPRIPGAMAYGSTKREASQRVLAVALRTLADNIDEGKGYASISKLFSYGLVHE